MGVPSIAIENISKRFRIGAPRQDYATLRDRISGLFRRRVVPPESREIWALRHVSFEMEKGEALGLIGHNGAGKSTLLKILSRITEPTEGRALLHGRVASLLEVGTGFHPELTGRENIYINGAILGMSRAEVHKNFDAIVAFAEVERFLETPVKRYSSGMFVRLAFAVAAHLTPEILLVDEVLAVGDFEFQRRCLGRLNEVAHSGRTVVFVSHNLESIERLCTRAVLMRKGQVADEGTATAVVARYLSQRTNVALFDFSAITDRAGNGRATILAIEILDERSDTPLDAVLIGVSFRIRVHYESKRLKEPVFGLAILTQRNERVFLTTSAETGLATGEIEGRGAVECLIVEPNILPGQYHFELWISDPEDLRWGLADHLRLVGVLEIVPNEELGHNAAALMVADRGRILLRTNWKRSA